MDNKELFRAMRMVIKNKNLDEVIALVSSHREVINRITSFGTMLHMAAKRGNYDICKYLIEEGFDVNLKGGAGESGPIHEAADSGDIRVIKLMIDSGAEFDLSSAVTNPLFAATYNYHLDAVKFFIEQGVDFKIKYEVSYDDELTLVKYARLYGRTAIAEYLESID